MSFKKGESGNILGRKPGSKDKKKQAIRDAYQSLIEDNLPNLQTWITDIADKDKLKAFELILKLSEYVVPKQKAIELKDDRPEVFTVRLPKFEELTDEELDNKIKDLEAKIKLK